MEEIVISHQKKIVNVWKYSPSQISKETKLFANWYFLVAAIIAIFVQSLQSLL